MHLYKTFEKLSSTTEKQTLKLSKEPNQTDMETKSITISRGELFSMNWTGFRVSRGRAIRDLRPVKPENT